MSQETTRLSDAECLAAFAQLFPQGFAGPDVLAEIAPERWENSPLTAVFHPSPEQVYEETCRIHRNLDSLGMKRGREPRPEPTLEEVKASFRETPLEPEREIGELVGQCLWDVFSDNHDVLADVGRVIDIGSFRAAGEFLAERRNEQTGRVNYDYMDFYLGTSWIAQRADLSPVYRMIFRRLRLHGMDWVYHFPRLYLTDFRPLQRALKEEQQPEWAQYSPEAALCQEREEEEREQGIAKLRADLDEAHREALEAAQDSSPPKSVSAYRVIYGDWPRGWPPTFDL